MTRRVQDKFDLELQSGVFKGLNVAVAMQTWFGYNAGGPVLA